MINTNRRAVLAGMLAAPAASVLVAGSVAAADHSDIELIQLGAEFDRRHALWKEAFHQHGRTIDAFDGEFIDGIAAAGLSLDAHMDAYWRARRENGIEALVEHNSELLARTSAVADKIREIPAKTMEGLAVKARVAAFDASIDLGIEDDGNENWDVVCVRRFLREAAQLLPSA